MDLPIPSFIIGCLLGDSHMSRRGVITFEHSVKQTPYLTHKFELCRMHDFCTSKAKLSLVKRIHTKTKKESISKRFFTKSLFADLYSIFYVSSENGKNKKMLSPLLGPFIDYEVLAYWFMDDGGLGGKSKYGLVIDLTCYSAEEQVWLQKLLLQKFDLITSLHSSEKSTKLFFKRQTVFAFVKGIRPYIIPSMEYKIKVFLEEVLSRKTP